MKNMKYKSYTLLKQIKMPIETFQCYEINDTDLKNEVVMAGYLNEIVRYCGKLFKVLFVTKIFHKDCDVKKIYIKEFYKKIKPYETNI